MADELPMPVPKTKRLTLKQQRFVELYVVSGNGADAVRQAGYSHRRANSTAANMLRTPAVRAEIDAYRAKLRARAEYTHEKAMKELDEAMTFAKATDNAAAYVRAVELRGKLSGLLVDRVDARIAVGAFSLNVVGLGSVNGD